MKMLSTDEIGRLYAEAEKNAEDYLRQYMEADMKVHQEFIQPLIDMCPDLQKHMSRNLKTAALMRTSLLRHGIDLGTGAQKRVNALDFNTTEGQEEAKWVLTHEFYVQTRISKECSQDEGRGISSTLDGLFGEKLTVFELELCIQAGYPGKILHNLEFEVGNRTIQIDVVFITQKGVFVIESKNYDGSIHGAEHQNKWTLQTRRKDYQFNNPVLQNQTHISVIQRAVQCRRCFSVIAFNDTSELEYIDIHSQDVFVLNLFAFRDFMKDMFDNEPDALSEQEVEAVTMALRRYCADDPESNPNYKAPRGYFSARTKAKDDSGNSTGVF